MSTPKDISSSSIMHVEFTLNDSDRMTSFVVYSSAHSSLKWKKMCVRSYEMEIMKQLRGSHMTQTKKTALTRAMTYYPAYPGTSRRTIMKDSFETFGNDYEQDVESDFEIESTYLFKDPPPESKFKLEQLAVSSEVDEKLKDRISSLKSGKTASRINFSTPERLRLTATMPELRSLSPSLNKLKLSCSSSSQNDSISVPVCWNKVRFLKLGKVSKAFRGQLPFLHIGSAILRTRKHGTQG
ncbi:PREDICTED: uncharacterized protein LOC105363034 [Ceratosolen solmsi marchali]|uniref:Uncharacterized protein LOC105363034 n=1 Tax=Ceratosolen solmsi marchali TaxID=326594 RepID=A0AAJ6YJ04_9HYME|nr:PREDICTED: uncharacterized protein LOC105363034 [Ceratosolen solmsi marchali]